MENQGKLMKYSVVLGSGRLSCLCLLPTSSSQPKTELENENWFVFTGAGNPFSSIFFCYSTLKCLFIQELIGGLLLCPWVNQTTDIDPKLLPQNALSEEEEIVEVSTSSFCLGLAKGLKNLTRKQSEKRRSK